MHTPRHTYTPLHAGVHERKDIYMPVHTYAYIHACVHDASHIIINTCIHAHMPTHVHADSHTHIHIQTHAGHTPLITHTANAYIHTHGRACIHTDRLAGRQSHIFTGKHACRHAHTYRLNIQRSPYKQTNKHTYIYVYSGIHAYRQTSRQTGRGQAYTHTGIPGTHTETHTRIHTCTNIHTGIEAVRQTCRQADILAGCNTYTYIHVQT